MVKLSVICPFYNEEKYIKNCIESILDQDFPRDEMEVLFVDGQSSDDSRKIVECYCAQYPFMRVLDNPRRVVPCAMNLGIANSSGDYLIRLDMHASYERNYFPSLVKYLDLLKADNVGCAWKTDVLHKTPISLAIREVLSNRLGIGNSTFRLGVEDVQLVDTVPFGCFPRSTFEKYGLYDERLVRNQDIELNKRIVRNGGKIYIVPDTSCTYYARETYLSLAENNFKNGKWNIWTVYLTKAFRSLSIRHFIPMAFLVSLIIPLLMSCFYFPFIYIFASLLLIYLCVISLESCKISMSKQMNFVSLLLAYITLHISYGAGSLVGLLTLPFCRR